MIESPGQFQPDVLQPFAPRLQLRHHRLGVSSPRAARMPRSKPPKRPTIRSIFGCPCGPLAWRPPPIRAVHRQRRPGQQSSGRRTLRRRRREGRLCTPFSLGSCNEARLPSRLKSGLVHSKSPPSDERWRRRRRCARVVRNSCRLRGRGSIEAAGCRTARHPSAGCCRPLVGVHIDDHRLVGFERARHRRRKVLRPLDT